ncbi:hypothetical protein DK254_15980 [Pseudomonas sp. RW407]|nr:hypothetical protein DK254_15980 [Pseudomonas sp. RW407]
MANGEPGIGRITGKAGKEVVLRIAGQDQGNNYDYRVILSLDELINAVRFELSKACTSIESKAIYEGALSTIATLLEQQ